MTAYILECRPKNASGVEVLKTFGWGLPDEAYLNQSQPYPLRMNLDFAVDTQVYSDNLPGDSTVSIGSVTLNNVDGRLDDLLDLSWGGAELVLKSGPDWGAYNTFNTYFTGAVQELAADTTTTTIVLRDAAWRLMKATQPNVYLGSGGKEGGRDLVGVQKPLCIGFNENMTPVIVDVPYLTYQLHDGPMQSITGVWDDAVAITFQQDYTSYALLIAAKIPPGYYATCLAEGFIRLGAPPAGTITVDGRGQYAAYTDLASLLYQSLVGRFGIPAASLDKSSFDQLALDAPKPVSGLYYPRPELELTEFLQTAISTADSYWAVDSLGRIFVRQFKFTTSTMTITGEYLTDLRRQVSSKPVWKARAEYRRNLTVITSDQLRFQTKYLAGVLSPQEIIDPFTSDFVGQFETYIGDQQLNDIGLIDFQKIGTSDWLSLRADGTYVVSNPPSGTSAAVIRASVDEFRVDRTLTVTKGSTTFYLNYGDGKPYLHYRADGKPVTAGQEVEIFSVGASVTAISAADSRGVNVPLISRNGRWYVSIDNVTYLNSLTEVTVTATSAAGTSRLSVPIFIGASSTYKAIADAGKTADWPNVRDTDGTKPENGATKGLGGELLAGRTPQQIVNDLDLNADSLALQLAVADNLQNLVTFNTTIMVDDVRVPVTTYAKNSVAEIKTETSGILQTLSLMGVVVGDGVTNPRAWQMDLNTIRVQSVDEAGNPIPGKYEALSERLATTASQMGANYATISRLDKTLVGPEGSLARSVLELDVDGHISGMVLTNTGKASEIAFKTSIFKIVSDDGSGQLFTPFKITGNKIYMTNVVVDTIEIGAVTTETLDLLSIRRAYTAELTSNGIPPYNRQTREIISLVLPKDINESDVIVEFFMRIRLGRYAGYFNLFRTDANGSAVLMDRIEYHAPEPSNLNNYFSFRMPMSYKRKFAGIPAGVSRWYLTLTHLSDNDDNDAGFLEIGSNLFVEEQKR